VIGVSEIECGDSAWGCDDGDRQTDTAAILCSIKQKAVDRFHEQVQAAHPPTVTSDALLLSITSRRLETSSCRHIQCHAVPADLTITAVSTPKRGRMGGSQNRTDVSTGQLRVMLLT